MRQGEIFKLRWTFVSLNQGVINLPGEITKTGKPRSVPITPRLRAELDVLKEKARGKDDALVFGITTNIKDAWKAACKDAGLSGVRFHDLRHSAITRWIAAGINPALAMKMSGHDSMTTFQRYLNPQAYTLREVAEKLHNAHEAEWSKEEASPDEYIN
jgi:integrase